MVSEKSEKVKEKNYFFFIKIKNIGKNWRESEALFCLFWLGICFFI